MEGGGLVSKHMVWHMENLFTITLPLFCLHYIRIWDILCPVDDGFGGGFLQNPFHQIDLANHLFIYSIIQLFIKHFGRVTLNNLHHPFKV